jgi:hypothetical protein
MYCFATISNEIAGEGRLFVLNMCVLEVLTYLKQRIHSMKAKIMQIHSRYRTDNFKKSHLGIGTLSPVLAQCHLLQLLPLLGLPPTPFQLSPAPFHLQPPLNGALPQRTRLIRHRRRHLHFHAVLCTKTFLFWSPDVSTSLEWGGGTHLCVYV